MLEVDNTCDGRQLVYHSDPSCLTTARFRRDGFGANSISAVCCGFVLKRTNDTALVVINN